MKKGIFLRAAAVLMILTLFSTSIISGTFAKYVTTGSVSDTARVAKWGVSIEAKPDTDNKVFNTQYNAVDGTTTLMSGISVKSSSTDNVVAPGTSGSVTYVVSGTPEVEFSLKLELTYNNDIVIPAGKIGTDNPAADYHPVKFTLTKKDGSNTAVEVFAGKTLEEAIEFLTTYSADNFEVSATEIAREYTLSWEWAFDTDNGANDELDTYLGNVAAGSSVEGVSTAIDFTLSITATQID